MYLFLTITFDNSNFSTGRCQQSGTAYTFFTNGNARQARELVGVLEEAGQKPETSLLELARMNSNGKNNSRSRYNVRLPNQMGMYPNQYGNRPINGVYNGGIMNKNQMNPRQNSWQQPMPQQQNQQRPKRPPMSNSRDGYEQNTYTKSYEGNTWRGADGTQPNDRYKQPNSAPRFQNGVQPTDGNTTENSGGSVDSNGQPPQQQYRQQRPNNYQNRNGGGQFIPRNNAAAGGSQGAYNAMNPTGNGYQGTQN